MSLDKTNNKMLVTKSNELIEASYKLTTNEQRIILMLAAKVQPEDQEFKRYRIQVSEFVKILDLKSKGVHNDIQEIIKGLMKKTFGIRKEKSILYLPWLASAEYFVGQGYMELEFSPKLKPYLLQLKERFTTYRLHNVMQLRSVYSIRIYELLKQYAQIGSRLFELDDLKFVLGIEKNEYQKYGHFKAKVLKVAQKELQEKTDIAFDFEEIKNGRKVAKLNFIIRKNGKSDSLETSFIEDEPGLIARLREFGLTEIQIDHIVKNYDESYILENLEIVEKDYKAGKVKNLTGYTYTALEQDFRKDKAPIEKKYEQKDKKHNNGVPDHILEQKEKQKELDNHEETLQEESYEEKIKRRDELLVALGEK
ncbi:Initiator Replication protein [Aneurinibacillus thermoaerophilus]|uniref:Initiator Replication protein n=1 Tax=Aneurinibacillus thermoaerophilus TaxID=143495 RepID=A0A1G8FTB3_ANETH|nr:replication initiation protein [Aneurinibacillus thermoaerophilus]SDH85389.1 Initiator Replication protein [Aneurinibacillus thermoaerophilus]